MVEVREYVDAEGNSPFQLWLDGLNTRAADKVLTTLERMRLGNLSEVKSVGGGVLERRIDFGPGYRLYFGRDSEALIILLVGGIKKRQQRDIKTGEGALAGVQAERVNTICLPVTST